MKELLLKGVNALEVVYGWLLEIAAIVALIILLNGVLKWFLLRLSKRFEKRQELWKNSVIIALIPPLTSFVWLIAVVESLHFIWSHLTKEPPLIAPFTIIKIGFILAAAWFFLRWKRQILLHMQEKGSIGTISFDVRKMDAINKVLTLAIYLIAIFLLLEQTGSSMNTLIAFGGISGLAIAFASQQIIANFFGGIMIYLTHPFDIGDWIQLPEKAVEGNVEEIGWYTTEIRTFEKRPIYIPNSLLTNVLVTNPSRMTHRRFNEVIKLRHQDIPELSAIIQDLKDFFLSHPD